MSGDSSAEFQENKLAQAVKTCYVYNAVLREQKGIYGMNQARIYHGSNMIVDKPRIMINGHYKDFGYGFYCTKIEKQARRWAMTKRGESIVNRYLYKKRENLKICVFENMTEEWLQFVVHCRRGIEHQFDIVEGPMADDQIWDYVEDFMDGNISKPAFWELVKFKYPTHQMVFCTEAALETIEFEGSVKA